MIKTITEKITATFPFLSKAVIASLIATCVDFGLLAFLTEIIGLHYQLSACIGFYAGTNVTYFLSITWIFPHRSLKSKILEYILFFAVGTVGVGLNALLLWFFTEVTGLYYLLSKIISGSTVFFWNFYARKHILFRERKDIAARGIKEIKEK
ncbi:MAG: GtrA family protein [Spirochaetales bacterium]|nr:GtrA family protein [Spirochaetales bacterium]